MKKYKVYCEDLGYEQIVEADNDEDAISMGYNEVSNNLHEYVVADEDNIGGTKNTEKGSELYWDIENTIKNTLDKKESEK